MINLCKLNILNEYAEAISKLYDIPCPIQNVSLLVEKMNGSICKSPSFSTNITFVKKTGEDSFVINIREEENIERMNHHILQYIGCLFLYMGFCTNELWERSSYFSLEEQDVDIQEIINHLAICLLMPKNEFLENIEKNTKNEIIDFLKVAKDFNTIPFLAQLRYNDLKKIL